MMAALENEVLRNLKPSFGQSFLSPEKLVSSSVHTSVDRSLPRVRAGFADSGEGDGSTQDNPALRSDLLDYNMDSVAEAKARLQELQKGAETLEAAYRDYQQRAVHSTISLTLPTRPHPSMAHPLRHTTNTIFSQTHSLYKTKPTETSKSLQPAATLSLDPNSTMYTAQTGQPRVASEELKKQQTRVLNDYSALLLSKPLQQSVPRPQEGSGSPSRQLSHELHFDPRVNLQRDLSGGTV